MNRDVTLWKKRNAKIRETYDALKKNGATTNSAFEEISEIFFISFDTVRQIILDPKYETRYAERKEKK